MGDVLYSKCREEVQMATKLVYCTFTYSTQSFTETYSSYSHNFF